MLDKNYVVSHFLHESCHNLQKGYVSKTVILRGEKSSLRVIFVMRKLKIYLYKNYHSFFWFSSNCCVLKRDYVRQKLILSLISFTPNLSLLEKDMLAKIVNLWQNCLLFFIRKLPWLGKLFSLIFLKILGKLSLSLASN